jgi:hypothetical protein
MVGTATLPPGESLSTRGNGGLQARAIVPRPEAAGARLVYREVADLSHTYPPR